QVELAAHHEQRDTDRHDADRRGAVQNRGDRGRLRELRRDRDEQDGEEEGCCDRASLRLREEPGEQVAGGQPFVSLVGCGGRHMLLSLRLRTWDYSDSSESDLPSNCAATLSKLSALTTAGPVSTAWPPPST